MAEGDRPLAVKAPRIRATWRQVMSDSLNGSQVGWARGLTEGGETQFSS